MQKRAGNDESKAIFALDFSSNHTENNDLRYKIYYWTSLVVPFWNLKNQLTILIAFVSHWVLYKLVYNPFLIDVPLTRFFKNKNTVFSDI